MKCMLDLKNVDFSLLFQNKKNVIYFVVDKIISIYLFPP